MKSTGAGYFSSSTDGREQQLTPEFLEGLTPSRLSGISAGTAAKSAGSHHQHDTWYYAVDMAADTGPELKVGQEVSLRLSKGLAKRTPPAHIYAISAGGKNGRMAGGFLLVAATSPR